MNMKITPITPNEIMDNLVNIIPDFVIQSVNNILTKKFRGNRISITLKEVETEILKISNTTSKEIYDNKWYDFESIYIKNGWEVTYHTPDRDESYDPYFTFNIKKK